MQTKLEKLRQLMAAGDHRAALKLAASWAQLGKHKDAIQRGWAALSNPDFYRGIEQDPDALVAAGLAAIRDRYTLPDTPFDELVALAGGKTETVRAAVAGYSSLMGLDFMAAAGKVLDVLRATGGKVT